MCRRLRRFQVGEFAGVVAVDRVREVSAVRRMTRGLRTSLNVSVDSVILGVDVGMRSPGKEAFATPPALCKGSPQQVADLAAAKGQPGDGEAADLARAALDGYLNFACRCALRATATPITYLTHVLALHDRIRLDNTYLAWELAHHRLRQPAWWHDRFLRLIAGALSPDPLPALHQLTGEFEPLAGTPNTARSSTLGRRSPPDAGTRRSAREASLRSSRPDHELTATTVAHAGRGDEGKRVSRDTSARGVTRTVERERWPAGDELPGGPCPISCVAGARPPTGFGRAEQTAYAVRCCDECGEFVGDVWHDCPNRARWRCWRSGMSSTAARVCRRPIRRMSLS